MRCCGLSGKQPWSAGNRPVAAASKNLPQAGFYSFSNLNTSSDVFSSSWTKVMAGWERRTDSRLCWALLTSISNFQSIISDAIFSVYHRDQFPDYLTFSLSQWHYFFFISRTHIPCESRIPSLGLSVSTDFFFLKNYFTLTPNNPFLNCLKFKEPCQSC